MSGFYIYAVAGSRVSVRGRGVFGRPLRAIPAGSLRVVAEAAVKAPRPGVAALKAQSRVLARLVTAGADVLPVRFGTFVPNLDELRRLIDRRRTQLARALRHTEGRVQMTVRVRLDVPRAPSAATRPGGAAYLESRLSDARARRSSPVLRSIDAAAKPYARASDTDWHDGATARIHHLVSRGRVAAYTRAVERAVREQGIDAVLTGPWAPFAFAEIA